MSSQRSHFTASLYARLTPRLASADSIPTDAKKPAVLAPASKSK